MERRQGSRGVKKYNMNVAAMAVKVVAAVMLLLVSSCNITKHVPQGEYLLDDVDINIVDDNRGVSKSELRSYLRQEPNHEVLGGLKLQLWFYNLSGHDSTKWANRWIQRVGTPPVIYDQELTDASVNQLQTALVNRGFMNSVVESDTSVNVKKRRINVRYNIMLNEPHYIDSIIYNIPNDTLRQLILADSTDFVLKQGTLFDRTQLDLERQGITNRLREKGYFAFNKEYITFTADTAEGRKDVILTLNTMPPYYNSEMDYYKSHEPFFVRKVTYVTNYDPLVKHGVATYSAPDTVAYNGISILYDEHYIRPSVVEECNFVIPGRLYNSADIDRTYRALGRLGILKFVNVEVVPVGRIDGKIWVDAYFLLTKGKSQTVSLSLEGTNSEGDLGFGVGASYSHRNIAKGSEVLDTKFRASYESLSGDLSGLINENYSEYSGEVGITFPKFKFPFLKKEFKQKVLATTEFLTTFNYQERPEYTRVIAGAGWKYHWSNTHNRTRTRHTFNLIDVSYIYLPNSQTGFLDDINNPLLRYSYEDHFIMRIGYSYYHSNKRQAAPLSSNFQRNVYTIRAAAETAGNLLYGISNLTNQKRYGEAYEVFGIRYSQYAKVDADFSYTHSMTPRHSFAFHLGAGAAIPYGNATVLPFEKRFYAGGANSVRGWGVRTLGPGCFDATNSVNSFIYQCGDIRLDLNVEYRAKLFWVLELGLFVDAGNIWTIKEYESQPGGAFKLNEFYKQIAVAYGLGLRLDFTYFLLRFDLGIKAHNPARNQERWPLIHPDWSRDATFHFSVGYPF